MELLVELLALVEAEDIVVAVVSVNATSDVAIDDSIEVLDDSIGVLDDSIDVLDDSIAVLTESFEVLDDSID